MSAACYRVTRSPCQLGTCAQGNQHREMSRTGLLPASPDIRRAPESRKAGRWSSLEADTCGHLCAAPAVVQSPSNWRRVRVPNSCSERMQHPDRRADRCRSEPGRARRRAAPAAGMRRGGPTSVPPLGDDHTRTHPPNQEDEAVKICKRSGHGCIPLPKKRGRRFPTLPQRDARPD